MRRSIGQSGSIAILILPLLALLFAASLLVADSGRGVYLSARAQTAADVSVLSSLSIRSKALETIAERWAPLEKMFTSGTETGAVLPSGLWPRFEEGTRDLRNALPGYKGRIKAVVAAVVEANGVSRDQITMSDNASYDLGLEASDLVVKNEEGQSHVFKRSWFKRLWASDQKLGYGVASVRHTVFLNYRPVFSGWVVGKDWRIERTASGENRWDVPLSDPAVRSKGNGGFPRAWSDALDGSNVVCNPFPFFGGQLTPNRKPAEPSDE